MFLRGAADGIPGPLRNAGWIAAAVSTGPLSDTPGVPLLNPMWTCNAQKRALSLKLSACVRGLIAFMLQPEPLRVHQSDPHICKQHVLRWWDLPWQNCVTAPNEASAQACAQGCRNCARCLCRLTERVLLLAAPRDIQNRHLLWLQMRRRSSQCATL